jgi:hypothetical protein
LNHQRLLGRLKTRFSCVEFRKCRRGLREQKHNPCLHPAIRRAVRGYEESFYIGLRCFLKGETDGLYFLPLESGGYERLRFSRRRSSGGHPILRVEPVATEGLQRIKGN